jgi:hypothetical protein
MNDGQGQIAGGQGIPFSVQTVNAPAGSDASAVLALALPGQAAIVSTAPIDLGAQLPPDVIVADSSVGSSTSNVAMLALAGLIAFLLLVR